MSSNSGTTPVASYKAIYSDNLVFPEGGEFVVVKTTYPTTYGCNRGQVYSQRRMIMESDILPMGPSGEEAEPGVGTGFIKLERTPSNSPRSFATRQQRVVHRLRTLPSGSRKRRMDTSGTPPR
mmetsp:Transcript_20675/g.57418  ORF Transcript_20675/g.57418 Transcript_20675/m.57418 type:complete len:123 (+) Transcript_20675:265-633(+)